jgi:hypothetical protein
LNKKRNICFIQKSIGHENPVFTSDTINTANGILITTKLQQIEEEEDDDDKNNAGFEKLSGEGHPFGVFVLKIRERLIRIIEKQKVTKFSFISLIIILHLNRL